MIRAISLAFAVLLMASAPSLLAAPVSILNPSFEDPALTDGGFTASIITDWTISGAATTLAAGVFHPIGGGTHFTGAGATDGDQVAYSNGGVISQTLSETVQANTVYTLTVDVGDRRDANFSGFLIELLGGAAVLADATNTVAPNDGFLTATVSYTALPGDANLGMPLGIAMRALAGIQTDFDNVRLDATPRVPEPATGLLWLAGAGALCIRRRRV